MTLPADLPVGLAPRPTTPPQRTMVVQKDWRTYTVPADDRTYIVPDDE